jgi:hypothetical protein
VVVFDRGPKPGVLGSTMRILRAAIFPSPLCTGAL